MQDFLLLEKQFSEQELLFRDSVRHFVDAHVMPTIADNFENAHFPKDWIKKTAELGLLGMTLPEAYGGCNASYLAYGLACEELERGDSGIRSFVSVQNSLCMFPIFQFG